MVLLNISERIRELATLKVAQQEMMMYPKVIKPISYVFATAMITAFTIIVNIFSHFSLKKVDMVESLKSIE